MHKYRNFHYWRQTNVKSDKWWIDLFIYIFQRHVNLSRASLYLGVKELPSLYVHIYIFCVVVKCFFFFVLFCFVLILLFLFFFFRFFFLFFVGGFFCCFFFCFFGTQHLIENELFLKPSVWPIDWTLTGTTLRVRVNIGVMTPHKAPKMKSNHQTQFSV